MPESHPIYAPDDFVAVECYRRAMRALKTAEVEFLVGGAYALARYTGIVRHTKDFDVFVRRSDRDRALTALTLAGYRTEITYPHWLAKAVCGPYFIDLIYSSGNGAVPVDDSWFAHAVPADVLGEPARLCPPEESLWSKAFIMERNRYDGADVAHILRSCGDHLDWRRLLERFGPHWRVLFSHIVLFGFIYPAERDRIPGWVLSELSGRFQAESAAGPRKESVCQGTLLAAIQYLPDVTEWNYRDARLQPEGTLTPAQVAEWTEGVLSGR